MRQRKLFGARRNLNVCAKNGAHWNFYWPIQHQLWYYFAIFLILRACVWVKSDHWNERRKIERAFRFRRAVEAGFTLRGSDSVANQLAGKGFLKKAA